MNDRVVQLEQLIDSCTADELEEIKRYLDVAANRHPLEIEWKIDGRTILDAIHRSTDITKRGMRGIIAEAVFEREVLPAMVTAGWVIGSSDVSDPLYDSLLRRDHRAVRIQIKLLRLERGQPKRFHAGRYDEELYVVEVQKTRSGKRKRKVVSGVQPVLSSGSELENTRPYSFTDFDILAVNLHPLTGVWTDFRYTVATWLLPRWADSTLIEVMQPVGIAPNNVWTEDLVTCLEWLGSGESRRVLTELKHVARRKTTPSSSLKCGSR
jgi:hypothetical protein